MEQPAPIKKTNKFIPWLKFAALIIGLTLLALAVRDSDFTFKALVEKIRSYPTVSAILVFGGLYAFVTVAPVPGRDVFKLVAAAVWGVWLSTFSVVLGEMIAAVVAFFLARMLGKELIDKIFGARLTTLYEKLNKAGFRNMLILRVLPITPYRMFNFAAGVTDLPFWPYFFGSLIGIFIRTLFFQSLFAVFGDYLAKKGVTIGQILAVSLLMAFIMIPSFILYNRRKTKRNASESKGKSAE